MPRGCKHATWALERRVKEFLYPASMLCLMTSEQLLLSMTALELGLHMPVRRFSCACPIAKCDRQCVELRFWPYYWYGHRRRSCTKVQFTFESARNIDLPSLSWRGLL